MALRGNIITAPSGRRVNLVLPDGWEEAEENEYGLIVHLHGGGWAGGNHEAVPNYWSCAEEGYYEYAVASIEYPLAPALQGQALLDDIVDTISWLLTVPSTDVVEVDAIDRERWLLAGESVGGYLALKTAERQWGVAPRAVIAVSPPVNLRTMSSGHYPPGVGGFNWFTPDSGLAKFLGFNPGDERTTEQDEQLVQLSARTAQSTVPLWIASHRGDSFVPTYHTRDYVSGEGACNLPRLVHAHLLNGAYHGARVMDDANLVECMMQFVEEVAS